MQNEQKTKTSLSRWIIRTALILVDVFIVNIAFFMALVIRFYVNSVFHPAAEPYVSKFVQFAPWYTLCCIIIFAFFKMYNGMWRFAGINDANRIVLANLVTCAVQVLGTLLTVGRMPNTYYIIGAVIQLVLTCAVRFSYRFIMRETTRLARRSNSASVNVMIIGVGESARVFLRQLYSDKNNVAHPVCAIDYRKKFVGRSFDGLPVVGGIDAIANAIIKYHIKGVIIADSFIPHEDREEVKKICTDLNVGIQDFSGYIQNGTTLGFNQLMRITDGPVRIIFEGKTRDYDNAEAAAMDFPERYAVKSIASEMGVLVVVIERDYVSLNNVDDEWVHNYEKETGEEVSFF